MRKIRELPGLQNLKVFAIAGETALKTVPSLPYYGIIPKVLEAESLKESGAYSLRSSWGTQEPSHAPDLQAELMPVA